MKRIAIAACLAAFPAAAEVRNVSGSTVEIRPTTSPGAAAEVVFLNRPNNGPQDNGSFPLALGEINAQVRFTWNAWGNADEIAVDPGAGFIAIPDVLEVDEMDEGVLLIYPVGAIGM